MPQPPPDGGPMGVVPRDAAFPLPRRQSLYKNRHHSEAEPTRQLCMRSGFRRGSTVPVITGKGQFTCSPTRREAEALNSLCRYERTNCTRLPNEWERGRARIYTEAENEWQPQVRCLESTNLRHRKEWTHRDRPFPGDNEEKGRTMGSAPLRSKRGRTEPRPALFRPERGGRKSGLPRQHECPENCLQPSETCRGSAQRAERTTRP